MVQYLHFRILKFPLIGPVAQGAEISRDWNRTFQKGNGRFTEDTSFFCLRIECNWNWVFAWQMEHWVPPIGGWQLWLIWIYIKPFRAMLLLPWKHTLSWSRPGGLTPAGWMVVAGQELVQYCRPKNVLLERSHESWSRIDAFFKGSSRKYNQCGWQNLQFRVPQISDT